MGTIAAALAGGAAGAVGGGIVGALIGAGFPAELLDRLDRLLDRALDAVGELLDRLVERGRVELERDRKHAPGREYLRLTHVKDLALGIGRAGLRDRRQQADRAYPPVGDDLLAVEVGRVHLPLGALQFVGPGRYPTSGRAPSLLGARRGRLALKRKIGVG